MTKIFDDTKSSSSARVYNLGFIITNNIFYLENGVRKVKGQVYLQRWSLGREGDCRRLIDY
jgi:hypothetical protein